LSAAYLICHLGLFLPSNSFLGLLMQKPSVS
jgi:hypothetical protein